MNYEFYNYLKPYLIKLQEVIGNDFVVFGSAPLYLYGVVPFVGKINDLDVFTKDESIIPSNAQVVTFHKNINQKMYKISIDDLVVDIGPSWLGYEEYINKYYTDPIVVDGFKFANLNVIEEWKREMVNKYDRQKDRDYLQAIREFRKNGTI